MPTRSSSSEQRGRRGARSQDRIRPGRHEHETVGGVSEGSVLEWFRSFEDLPPDPEVVGDRAGCARHGRRAAGETANLGIWSRLESRHARRNWPPVTTASATRPSRVGPQRPVESEQPGGPRPARFVVRRRPQFAGVVRFDRVPFDVLADRRAAEGVAGVPLLVAGIRINEVRATGGQRSLEMTPPPQAE